MFEFVIVKPEALVTKSSAYPPFASESIVVSGSASNVKALASDTASPSGILRD
jgi:hypothetical protein